MKRKSLLYLLLILSAVAHGNIYFKHLGKPDGLSQISVLSICQDELGRMWFGTLEGLNCYDGNQMKTYKPTPDNKEYLVGNEISNIVSDKQGSLFFTSDGNLVRYDLHKDRFSSLQLHTQTLFAKDHTVWAAVNDSLFQWNREKETFQFVYKAPFHKRISRLYVDANNTFWLGTKKGLYRVDNIHNPSSPACVIPDINVLSLYRDSRGNVWVATFRNGMYKIENGISRELAIQKEFGISNNDVRCFVEDNEGSIWLGTFNGLNKIDTLGHISYYQKGNKPGNLRHSSIFSLYKDLQGTIWVGTYYGGVNYFNPDVDIFSHYTESTGNENGLSFPFVGNMVEDKRGDVWICTEGGGLNCLERESGRFIHYLMDEKNNGPFYNLKCIAYDEANDQLYIGTHKQGGLCFDIPSKRVIYHSKEFGDSWIKAAFREGKLYLLTAKGMFVKEGKGDFQRLFPQASEANAEGTNFLIDSQNHLWITQWKKIVCINLNNPAEERIYRYGENGLGNYYAQGMAESHDSTLFFGTAGSGIYQFDKKKGEFIARTDIEANYCYYMTITPKNYLAICNDRGLLIYHPQTKEKRLIDVQSLHLSAINEGCGLLVCRNGQTFVGGVEGMSSFTSSSLRETSPDYNLYFSSLGVNNRPVATGADDGILKSALPFVRQIELAHNENNISIAFSSSNYGSNTGGSNIYEYKLEGFSKEWNKTTGNAVVFTNLPPGNYKLVVRELQQNPGDKRHVIELSILINRPWWNTWWTWILYLCIITAIGWKIISEARSKMQLRASLAQEKLEKEKNEELIQAKIQFFANISHEFRTPLTLIISQIEALLQTNSLSPFLRNRLSKIYRNTFQFKELISELLDFRKMERGKLHLHVCQMDLIPYLKQIHQDFTDQANLQNLQLVFHSEVESLLCWFDGRQLRKVLTNLLSNALKHTPEKGKIELQIADKGDSIIIKVIDSGKGIPEKALPFIFDRFYQADESFSSPGSGIGLALSKGIVELHHGQIEVQSAIDYGSIFTVTLPKENLFKHDNYVTFVEADKAKYETILAPFTETAEAGNCATEETPEQLPTERAEKDCILIVEDNEELLQLLTDLLLPLYRVVIAMNGKDGLQKAMEERPDLILSDVMMPEMDGIEMCSKIKTDFDLCHTPVILLTALTSNDKKMEGLQCGADEYIGKPFNNKMLQAHIANILRNRKLLRQKFSQEMATSESPTEIEIQALALNPIDAKFLEQLEKIVEAHLSDSEFDVGTLAKEMALSRSAFYNKLKALSCLSPNEFIMNARLKHAAELLKNHPEIQITEIAYQVGFSSLRYFRHCFKACFNQSPQEYRGK